MKPKATPDNINSEVRPLHMKSVKNEANLLLHQLFTIYDEKYFFGKLNRNVEVRWSKRMTVCAGCTREPYEEKPCDISLSRPLLELRPLEDLLETLLHEMIHAYLWVNKSEEEEEHGPKFCAEMKRIEKLTGMKLEIFHEFISECNNLQTHVWKCNGPCRKTNSAHSVIRRSTNRPPSDKERWFREHENMCGGTYIKIKAPSRGKSGFNPRIEMDLRAYISNISKIPVEAKNNSVSPSKSTSSNDSYNSSDDMTSSSLWDSHSDFSDNSDFFTDEELAKKPKQTLTNSATPPKKDISKTASTLHTSLTPPPTEDKPKIFTRVQTGLPLDKKTTKTTARAKSLAPSPTQGKSSNISVTQAQNPSPFNKEIKTASTGDASFIPPTESKLKTASTGDASLIPPTESKPTKSIIRNKSATSLTKNTSTETPTTPAQTPLPLINKKTTKTKATRTKPVPTQAKNKTEKVPDTSKSSSEKKKPTKTKAPAQVSSVKKKPPESSTKIPKENKKAPESSTKTPKEKKKELPTKGKTKLAPGGTKKTKKYIWQCYGPCHTEAPLFGRVERLINRAPHKREKWFLLHEKDCGGNFVRLD